MTDKLTQERRSENMRRIRSTDTSPELTVRSLVHAMGFRYRLHVPSLPGRPDLVFPRLRKAVLVNGCFWHSHEGCKEDHMPKTRQDYWRPKLERNKLRDIENITDLKRLGWKVLVVWECEVSQRKPLARRLRRFLSGVA